MFVMKRINAARNSKKNIEKQDFLDAMDRIIGGMEKNQKSSLQLKRKQLHIMK